MNEKKPFWLKKIKWWVVILISLLGGALIILLEISLI